MADTVVCKILSCCVWIASILFALFFYSWCIESHYVSQGQTNLYLVVWLISTLAGIILHILSCLKCCEDNLDCIYGWTTLLSDLPLIVISIIIFEYMPPEVCQDPTIHGFLTALDVNVLFHLPLLLYRLFRSCGYNSCSCSVMVHVLELTFSVIILHTIPCIWHGWFMWYTYISFSSEWLAIIHDIISFYFY